MEMMKNKKLEATIQRAWFGGKEAVVLTDLDTRFEAKAPIDTSNGVSRDMAVLAATMAALAELYDHIWEEYTHKNTARPFVGIPLYDDELGEE